VCGEVFGRFNEKKAFVPVVYEKSEEE